MFSIRSRELIAISSVCGLLACAAANAKAGTLISDRATLDGLLGASASTEDFEKYIIKDTVTNAEVLRDTALNGITILNDTTVTNGEGPGLVIPGFSVTSDMLQWNGNQYYGLATQSIAGGTTLTISFTSTTNAFGIDLEAYAGYPNTFDATIYSPDNTTVLATFSDLNVSSLTPLFFGYQDAGGIGSVVFSNTLRFFSPILDNLTFGTAVPEPSSLVMGVIGLVVAAGVWGRRSAVSRVV